jgi:hypothetical protein
MRLAEHLRAGKGRRTRPEEVRAAPASGQGLSVVLETIVHRQLLPAILVVRSADQPTQTQVPDTALQEQEKIACQTLDLLLLLGFSKEDCLSWRGRGLVPIEGWSCGGVGPERGLRGGGRRGWCEEWARRG